MMVQILSGNEPSDEFHQYLTWRWVGRPLRAALGMIQ